MNNVDRSLFDGSPMNLLIDRLVAAMISIISSSMLSMIGSEHSPCLLLETEIFIVVPSREMSMSKQRGYSLIRFSKVSMEQSLPTVRQELGKHSPWKV